MSKQIKSLTALQQKSIIKNIILACKDITKLNKAGYQFISGCNGFIAHYDLNGFIGEYNLGWGRDYLAGDIIRNQYLNQYNNFAPGEHNAEYYLSKRDIYNSIVQALKD